MKTAHWLDIIMRSEMVKASRIQTLYQECNELLSIIVKSIITTKNRVKTDEIEKNSK